MLKINQVDIKMITRNILLLHGVFIRLMTCRLSITSFSVATGPTFGTPRAFPAASASFGYTTRP